MTNVYQVKLFSYIGLLLVCFLSDSLTAHWTVNGSFNESIIEQKWVVTVIRRAVKGNLMYICIVYFTLAYLLISYKLRLYEKLPEDSFVPYASGERLPIASAKQFFSSLPPSQSKTLSHRKLSKMQIWVLSSEGHRNDPTGHTQPISSSPNGQSGYPSHTLSKMKGSIWERAKDCRTRIHIKLRRHLRALGIGICRSFSVH